MDDKKVIIIGAGPAGLTAAYYIVKHTNYKPIILEESYEIGGISRTIEYNGNRMDIGGHRFFSKNEEINKIWNDIFPLQGAPSIDDKILEKDKLISKNGPNPEKEDKVMLIRNRVSRIFYLRKFFDYPINITLKTFRNMGLIKTIKVGFSYLYSCIFKRKEDSLKNFYINKFGKQLYEMFFEDYTEKLWGINPKYISADWGAQRVKGLSLISVLLNAIKNPLNKNKKVETSLIEQFLYPKFGPGQLWTEMASIIENCGGKIIFGAKVEKINTLNKKINSVTAIINDNEVIFSVDELISSMPIKDLISDMGKIVPNNISTIAKNLPYRDFITIGILVNKLKIKNTTKIKTLNNIIPDCWIYIQEKDVKIGRLQIFNNWSPYMVNDPQNTVWIGLEYFCNELDELWNMSDKDFIDMAVNELKKIGVIDNYQPILDSCRIKVKKAYPAYFGTYCEFDKVKEYLNIFDNLYCIGRNGQHRYNNMDHSMLTAIEAVKCITKNSSKENVWLVNTEKDYHEGK